MKHITAPLVALMFLAPIASAQEEGGLSLMERGAQLFLEGIMKEMEPALEEFEGLTEQMGPALRNFAEGMGPKLAEILDKVDDWSAYEVPEILPNGDIIIRRKLDRPMPSEKSEQAEPQIDL